MVYIVVSISNLRSSVASTRRSVFESTFYKQAINDPNFKIVGNLLPPIGKNCTPQIKSNVD